MPGLRKEVDTSDWKASDWRHARNVNIAFLAGWLAFWGVAFRAGLFPINWYLLVPSLVIAVLGGAAQVNWLIRVSIWLDNQKTLESAP